MKLFRFRRCSELLSLNVATQCVRATGFDTLMLVASAGTYICASVRGEIYTECGCLDSLTSHLPHAMCIGMILAVGTQFPAGKWIATGSWQETWTYLAAAIVSCFT